MAKQLNVNLSFTADTATAKKQIAELQEALQKVAQMPVSSSSLINDKEIQAASKAAIELQQHLQNAVNVNTGKLDLSRFSASLQKSNQNLTQYYNMLSKLGPTGQDAFLKLSKSIATAEAPVTRVNAKLAEMGTVLKNTARWQISSSILHGFMGTLQSAYGYAQDLNESLNNIRIVTGQTTDQMAEFAEKANQAAKELSTTTTAYTDAALIFYQQGLGDKEVEERTNAVIKMANVTGDSATDVSSYMTAIWNNFDDGSETLEHYADVITALGASTASSSSEIAEGLSKFASIGDTIGLSYDYATSILAALVANTRQSADVIGTSLRTIFARLQGLSLGETLEDGVDLNKYSKALNTIGVDILNMNGELKDANTILDETAAKWDTLTQAQKTALAQTVAGTRQYAQFVAMMEGWEDVQTNLETAAGSEGTLQEQADIYAESWEAARDRVKAAAEGIYDSILDDRFFIGINNGIASALEGVESFIDSLGGMQGIATTVGAIFLNVYARKLPDALNNLQQNFKVLTGQATQEMIQLQEENTKFLDSFKVDTNNLNSLDVQANSYKLIANMQKELIMNSKNMTEAEKESYQVRIKNTELMLTEVNRLAAIAEETQKTVKANEAQMSKDMVGNAAYLANENGRAEDFKANGYNDKIQQAEAKVEELRNAGETSGAAWEKATRQLELYIDKQIELEETVEQENKAFEVLQNKVQELAETSDALNIEDGKLTPKSIENLNKALDVAKQNYVDAAKAAEGYWSSLNEIDKLDEKEKTTNKELYATIETLREQYIATGKTKQEFDQEFGKVNSKSVKTELEAVINKYREYAAVQVQAEEQKREIASTDIGILTGGESEAADVYKDKIFNLTNQIQQYQDALQKAKNVSQEPIEIKVSNIEALSRVSSSLMMLQSAIRSISNAVEIFSDDDATTAERLGAAISVVTISLMAYKTITSAVNALEQSSIAIKTASTIATWAKAAGKEGETVATWQLVIAENALKIATLGVFAAVGAVIGVVLLLVAAYKKIQANSPEGRLKATQEEAAALAESLDEAKSKAEELQSAFDDYSSIIDTLNSCTKGTQEWRDALEEASASTTELLQEYPELLKQANLFDENGLINLDVLEQAVVDANSVVDTLNAANLMAQVKVNEAQLKVSTNNYAEGQNRYTEYTDSGSSYTNYNAANNDLQELLENYKTLNSENLDLEDALNVLGYTSEQLAEMDDNQRAAAEESASALLELAQQAINTSNSLDNATLSIINDWAEGEEIELDTGQAEIMQQNYQNAYDNMIEQLDEANHADSRYDNEKSANKVGNTGETIWDLWNDANGTNYHLQSNGIQGGDNNRTYHYIDENNDEKEVSYEQMKSTIAAAAALDQLGTASDKAAESLSNLDKNLGEEIASGIRNWIASGSFESMTQADFESMLSNIDTDESGNYDQSEVENYLKTALGTDDVVGLLGEDWYTDFDIAAQGYKAALDDISENLFEQANKINGISELSVADQKELSNTVKQAFLANGDAGASALIEQINTALENDVDISGLADVINNFNWDDASLADFEEALNSAGIDVQDLGIDIESIFDAMVTTSSVELSSIQEIYKEIQDIIDGLATGDTIDEEEYTTLSNQFGSEAMDGFFSVMADGTYQLIGAAEDFQNAINKLSQDQLLTNISESSQLTSSLNNTSADQMNGGAIQTQETSAAAVAYLETLDLTEDELIQLREVQDQYAESGRYTAESFELLNQLMAEHNITEEEYSSLIEQNNESLRSNSEALLSTASSLSELDALTQQVAANTNGVVYGYSEALISLASQYDNCTQEIEEYQNALANNNQELIKSTENSLRAAETVGELSEKYDLVAEDVETQAKLLKANNKQLDLSEEQAARLAVANQRMNRGVSTLNENFSDWKKTLKSTDHTTADYAETLNDAYDALADLTGALDASSIPLDFLDNTTESGAQHLQWLEQAANGDVTAINQLGVALGYAAVEAMEFDSSMEGVLDSNFASGFENNLAAFNNYKAEVLEGIANLQAEIQNGTLAAGQNVTSLLDGTGASWVSALNEMAVATGMSVEEMNSLLNQLGVQAKVDVVSVPQTMEVPTYTEYSTATVDSGAQYDAQGNLISPSSWSRTTWTVPGAPVTVEGYAQVAQISTEEGSVGAPQITYSGTGGSVGGGGVSPSSVSSSPSSGSGSGGGSSSDNREEKDPVEDLPDAYHDVTRAINRVSSAIDKLETKQSHLYGRELIESLKQENSLLQQQADNYEWLGQVINNEKSRIQSALSAYGVTFDKTTGEMTNYAEAYQNVVNAYNNVIAAYNASGQDDNDKKILEKAEESYEKFKDLLDEYDETLDKQLENEQNKLENLYTQIGNNYTAWETQIQITLDLSTARQEWQKFWQKVNKDIKSAFTDYAKEIGNLSSNFDLRSNDISTDIQAIKDIENAINTGNIGKEGSMFVSETEAANALLEYSDTLRDDAEDLYELYTDAWDEYLDGIDQVIDKWEDVIDEFDAINDSIEHQIKVVELLYKDGAAARNANAQLYDINNANGLAEMSALNSVITTLQNEREQLLAAGAKETDEDVQKITEAIQSNQETLESVIESYLEGLTEQFTNAVSIAMDTMETALTGGSSYDIITQHWEDAQYAAEGYYDEVERIYQLESLESKWESAINSSSSLKSQQKLKELMDEQLENLQSKTELTEYDIELAEKQLAVAQAQIALEEAQNNKNSMKLTRGSDGNWSYQYVADEDDVADKQQSLLDANQEWYEFTKTSWQDLTEEIWNDVQEAQERIAELMEEYNTADSERREQIAEELDYLYEYYYGEDGLIAVKSTELAEYQQNLNAATMNDLWALYAIDEENYALMTENEKALINSLKEEGINSYNLLKDAVAGNGGVYEQMGQKCEEINKESLTEWETTAKKVIDAWVSDPTSVQNSVKNAYATVQQAQKDYDKAVADGVKASGVNYANLATQISNLSAKISETTSKTTELIDETNKISDMASAVAKLEEKWYDVQDAITGAIYNLAQYLALLSGENVSYSYVSGRSSSSDSSSSGSSSSSSGSSGSSSTSGSGSAASSGGSTASADTIAGIAAAIWMDGATSGWGNDPTRKSLITEKFNAETAAAVQAYINAHGPNGDIYAEWASKRDQLKNYYTSSFDTGGYTGEWDDGSGKLAFLHSKELVLNAEDTENMLQAVNAARSIASISSSITESVANGVASMVSSLLGITKTNVSGITSNNTSTGDNNTFNITAEFPNAENVEDIREAIMSLPTLASQYLSQRKL